MLQQGDVCDRSQDRVVGQGRRMRAIRWKPEERRSHVEKGGYAADRQ